MRWHIFAIGKPRLKFATLGVSEYAGRLKTLATAEVHFVKATEQAGESAALLERTAGMFRIVLDERGDAVTSRALAQKISAWELSGPRDFAVIVGGADGHTEELRNSARWLWSLSPLTLQHELALVVALEQLYRAYTIKTGRPYHRD